jgi:hypothetical protein
MEQATGEEFGLDLLKHNYQNLFDEWSQSDGVNLDRWIDIGLVVPKDVQLAIGKVLVTYYKDPNPTLSNFLTQGLMITLLTSDINGKVIISTKELAKRLNITGSRLLELKTKADNILNYNINELLRKGII